MARKTLAVGGTDEARKVQSSAHQGKIARSLSNHPSGFSPLTDTEPIPMPQVISSMDAIPSDLSRIIKRTLTSAIEGAQCNPSHVILRM